MRVDTCADVCMDMCVHVQSGHISTRRSKDLVGPVLMSADMCVDMCVDMCTDMCVDMSIDLRVEMCTVMY